MLGETLRILGEMRVLWINSNAIKKDLRLPLLEILEILFLFKHEGSVLYREG